MKYFILAVALLLTGCSSDTKKQADQTPAIPGQHTAKALEIIPSGGYIYINVEEGDSTFWISTTDAWVKPGAIITFMEDVWMTDFESQSLGKTFDKILFVTKVTVKDAGVLSEEKQIVSKNTLSSVDDAGKFTVEKLYLNRTDLVGKKVTVTGAVIKVSEGILNNNWVHVQDGTGEGATASVIFASPSQSATVGNNVTATGVLAIDKDLGYGYFYPVLIESAEFTIESN